MAVSSPSDAGEQQRDGSAKAPKPPTRLLLVRHAVTAQTGPMLSGRLPGIDLSERGVEQAEAVAERLRDLPIAAVYASPIERTTQTAQHIAKRHGHTVRPLDGVIEAEYGEWSGKKIADLAKTDEWKVVQVSPSRARFPGGESIAAMQARMVATLEGLVADHSHETVVVVSHADPIKSAVAHFTGLHLDLFQRIHVAPASVTALELHSLGAVLLKLNDTGSLDDLRPAHAHEAEPATATRTEPDG